jgi:UDP-N-acetylglucosamine 2-epimerase (non-hydrolysing)
MSMKQRLLIVIGTRPEAIKLAPVVLEAQRRSDEFAVRIVRSSQHRDMLDQALADFGLSAEVDLDIMRPNQDLVQITTDALRGLYDTIAAEKPDWVIVQGDTTTSFVGALAAFYCRVRVTHVEAGLRTYDKQQPFPEEVNRCLTAQVTDLHCAPTAAARENLLREGIAPHRIFVTGNTAIDALLFTLRHAPAVAVTTDPVLLLTAHRRENHGEPMEHICAAVLELLARYPRLTVRYPVHPNPRVGATVFEKLSNQPRVTLSAPLDYRAFVLAMNEARIILTDSGGVQEEAPSLGKPVLVLRNTTERPEAVQAGTARLIGTDTDRIVREVSQLLDDHEHYASMARASNPYGDGRAAGRILDAIASFGAG